MFTGSKITTHLDKQWDQNIKIECLTFDFLKSIYRNSINNRPKLYLFGDSGTDDDIKHHHITKQTHVTFCKLAFIQLICPTSEKVVGGNSSCFRKEAKHSTRNKITVANVFFEYEYQTQVTEVRVYFSIYVFLNHREHT